MDTHTLTPKHQLAQAYAPGLTDRAALNRLAYWINSHPRLLRALKKTGYRGTEKFFSKEQMRLIFKYLGTP